MEDWDYIDDLLENAFRDWDCKIDKCLTEQREITKHVSMKDTKMVKDQLYQVKDTETFGKIIATNSAGKKVVEIMGTGEVKLYDMNQLEKVIPYTVSVRFNTTGKTYHYLCNKGQVDKDDLIIINGYNGYFTIAQIVAVDTKSEDATKFLNCYKLNTTIIKGEDF